MKPLIEQFSDLFIVHLNLWLLEEEDSESARTLSLAIVVEAERREWPEGWYEDPSVIPSIAAAMAAEEATS